MSDEAQKSTTNVHRNPEVFIDGTDRGVVLLRGKPQNSQSTIEVPPPRSSTASKSSSDQDSGTDAPQADAAHKEAAYVGAPSAVSSDAAEPQSFSVAQPPKDKVAEQETETSQQVELKQRVLQEQAPFADSLPSSRPSSGSSHASAAFSEDSAFKEHSDKQAKQLKPVFKDSGFVGHHHANAHDEETCPICSISLAIVEESLQEPWEESAAEARAEAKRKRAEAKRTRAEALRKKSELRRVKGGSGGGSKSTEGEVQLWTLNCFGFLFRNFPSSGKNKASRTLNYTVDEAGVSALFAAESRSSHVFAVDDWGAAALEGDEVTLGIGAMILIRAPGKTPAVRFQLSLTEEGGFSLFQAGAKRILGKWVAPSRVKQAAADLSSPFLRKEVRKKGCTYRPVRMVDPDTARPVGSSLDNADESWVNWVAVEDAAEDLESRLMAAGYQPQRPSIWAVQ
eukprot:gene7502-8929_t